jgi:hypothetical protein
MVETIAKKSVICVMVGKQTAMGKNRGRRTPSRRRDSASRCTVYIPVGWYIRNSEKMRKGGMNTAAVIKVPADHKIKTYKTKKCRLK